MQPFNLCHGGFALFMAKVYHQIGLYSCHLSEILIGVGGHLMSLRL